MIQWAAQAAAAFSLICHGTFTSGRPRSDPVETRPVEIVYRVDLGRHLWCSGNCETMVPLRGFGGTRIVFREQGDIFHPTGNELRTPTGETSDIRTEVNLANGVYLDIERYWSDNHAHYRMTNGTCARASFTGFPARR